MFTSIDYDKFRALRVTHVAARFEELVKDEANDGLTPEQLFLTAVDDALEQRRHSRVEKLIRQARFPIPHASVAEIDYREGRGVTAVSVDGGMVRICHLKTCTQLRSMPPTGVGSSTSGTEITVKRSIAILF